MGEESAAATWGEAPLRRHLAWLLVCLAYVYVFPYYERLNNPNENVRIWATRAIVEHGVLDIGPVEREWGWVNDKAISDSKKIYSSKAPGVSFLGVPVLFVHSKLRHMVGWPSPGKKAATFWLRLCAVELPMCLFLWFFARHIERVTRSATARDLLVVALGVGTLVYPYGVIFVGHSLAAALAFGGYMVMVRESQSGAATIGGRPRRWACKSLAWAGLLTGLSVLFEYQALLLAGVLAGYAAVRHGSKVLSFILGAVPPGLALGAYHTALFGRPWKFPYAAIENPEFVRLGHAEGFHGLRLPKLPAIGQFLFASDYGLFVFSPLLLLGAVCALYAAVRRPRREGLLTIAVCVVMFLFLSGMMNWRAGWCVGPRYITTVAPFLVAGIALVWPQGSSSGWLSALTAGLLIPSVLLNAISGAVYPHYPEQYNNPVFDLTFPLLGDGFIPYSLGQALHLPGLWSLAPLAVALVGAVSLGAGGGDPRPGRWALHSVAAVVIAAMFLLPLGRYGRKPDPGEKHATALVRSLWEPPPAARSKK